MKRRLRRERTFNSPTTAPTRPASASGGFFGSLLGATQSAGRGAARFSLGTAVISAFLGLLVDSSLAAASPGRPPTAGSDSSAQAADEGRQDRPRARRDRGRAKRRADGRRDAKHRDSGQPAPARDPEFEKYAIDRKTSPRPGPVEPIATQLPLELNSKERIGFIGNTLFERAQLFGQFETLVYQHHPALDLIVRNFAWSADTPNLQPRPANFADVEQHLTHIRADVIFAAFGFNESFAGLEGLTDFRRSLSSYLSELARKAFNGRSAPRIVLVSPIANENVDGVAAADLNNDRLAAYVEVMREVAADQNLGFADVFSETRAAMADPKSDLTFNGVHLTEDGYALFARVLFRAVFGQDPPSIDGTIRRLVVEKNRQYFRRYRPLNTYYYTGNRNRAYGYLDFLPAMRSFEILVENRERRIWKLARGEAVPPEIDDSNVPPLPLTRENRGANRWMSASDELESFKVDPRFEVNLFAGEEEFPEIAAPVQMRWDSRGRLWVACSTTYPHVYPGNEPNDRIVILEDTDGDGRADSSSVFADDLHVPLSFEFGDGGVYVSEEPHLSFIKDTDGDGKADFRRHVLTGFGCEDSHHALHDFIWAPDGALIFRESIFHHSQVETPYGPVRQQNSGWFRFEPERHRLTSFGTYPSTNPWGVTFDRWGQHVASHPIYASAFHALDPPYPEQHPRPAGLRAYSGTCGQEFVDFTTFPDELAGHFVKARYKPTNRIEIHRWVEGEYGYDEEYVGDLIFSSNLSFIPVDIRFGPRGALYICDWYNPIKGHMQYSLRDRRRDRHSGRIWRVTAKGKPLQNPPKISGASVNELLEILKRPEYRYRYWAKRELREREASDVKRALATWVNGLDSEHPEFLNHRLQALWLSSSTGAVDAEILRSLLRSSDHRARAAAVRELRYWHSRLPDAIDLLRRAANDPMGIVRMEAAIAASYVGSRAALDALLDVAKHPRGGHLEYAFACALGSHTLRPHWERNSDYAQVPSLLRAAKAKQRLVEPAASARDSAFDNRPGLKRIEISCLPEKMKYTVERFTVKTNQAVKLVFSNPDATDHNLVIVQPGALEEVGMAANDMARDPKNASSDFIPETKRHLIVEATPMIGPTRKTKVHVLRFEAPAEPGVYPYVCTFPGHWVVMTGEMIVVRKLEDVSALLAAQEKKFVRNWTLSDFPDVNSTGDERSVMRGMKVFADARCNQCHAVGGHGAKFGPDLTKIAERFKGKELLRQIIEPSSTVSDANRSYQIVTASGDVVIGSIVKETETALEIATNLLDPNSVVTVEKSDVEEKTAATQSAMPEGLLSVLTKEEILDLLVFLEAGGYQLPPELKKNGHKHDH